MKRDTLINVLLIIAGIVLAFALFGAGVLWNSRKASKTTNVCNPRGQLMTHNWLRRDSGEKPCHGQARLEIRCCKR